MIFQVANKYPPVAESGEGNDEPSQLTQSLIRKNGPEIRGLRRTFYGLAPQTEIFRCRFATKKDAARFGVMSKKGRNFFSQPTSAKETVRVMYLK